MGPVLLARITRADRAQPFSAASINSAAGHHPECAAPLGGSWTTFLQFGLDRDIDGAARDVQAAINAAHADLPTSLKTNPTYWEVQSSRTSTWLRGGSCGSCV
jgi:hypothetical protein